MINDRIRVAVIAEQSIDQMYNTKISSKRPTRL